MPIHNQVTVDAFAGTAAGLDDHTLQVRHHIHEIVGQAGNFNLVLAPSRIYLAIVVEQNDDVVPHSPR